MMGTELAILLELYPIGVRLLVLLGDIIALLAVCASENHINAHL